MPAVARAHRRTTHRPITLAAIATTAIGAPTLLAVPAVASDVPAPATQTPAVQDAALQAPVTTHAPAPAVTSAPVAVVRTSPATPVRLSPEETSYTVRRGDTLTGIARELGTTVREIQRANSLSGSLILAGQTLTVPGASAPANAEQTSSTGGSYLVSAGDTLIGIARAHGTSVREIQQANSLTGTVIRTGQTLTIPGAGGAEATDAAAPSSSASSTGGSYTVRAGDTLTGIARAQGTSVAEIAEANSIGSDGRIYVGQTLTMPGAAAAGPATSDPGNTSGGVGSTFAGRTYPEAVVGAANANRTALVASGVPSRASMQELVRSTAVSMGVDPRLALAHAFVESGFNHAAVSPANAIGTMQVIPSSGEWASDLVGRPLNIMNPQDNVVAGVAIIRALQRSADDSDQGIAAYYQGLGGVRAHGMYPDTENYVDTVRAAMNRF
ncbi:LysM peptidoglycan-binding domain-containing protein [Georgenia sp. Z1344]|uniref:lytic transglycosylase n=1 Tax=Georgenia sp. Z1344 TaxID=3416706 RepID=UPI003CEFDD14